jgi:hypothetical protein
MLTQFQCIASLTVQVRILRILELINVYKYAKLKIYMRMFHLEIYV